MSDADDGTEDFGERCRGTESCDCAECTAIITDWNDPALDGDETEMSRQTEELSERIDLAAYEMSQIAKRLARQMTDGDLTVALGIVDSFDGRNSGAAAYRAGDIIGRALASEKATRRLVTAIPKAQP